MCARACVLFIAAKAFRWFRSTPADVPRHSYTYSTCLLTIIIGIDLPWYIVYSTYTCARYYLLGIPLLVVSYTQYSYDYSYFPRFSRNLERSWCNKQPRLCFSLLQNHILFTRPSQIHRSPLNAEMRNGLDFSIFKPFGTYSVCAQDSVLIPYHTAFIYNLPR